MNLPSQEYTAPGSIFSAVRPAVDLLCYLLVWSAEGLIGPHLELVLNEELAPCPHRRETGPVSIIYYEEDIDCFVEKIHAFSKMYLKKMCSVRATVCSSKVRVTVKVQAN